MSGKRPRRTPAPAMVCAGCGGGPALLLLSCTHHSCIQCIKSSQNRCPACGRAVSAISGGPPDDTACASCRQANATVRRLACGHTACFSCVLAAGSACPSCGAPVLSFEYASPAAGGTPPSSSAPMSDAAAAEPLLQPPPAQQPQKSEASANSPYSDSISVQREFEGQVAVVTGGSMGIGAAVARTLAAGGASVVVVWWQHRREADEVVAGVRASGGSATAVQADVSQPEQVTRLVHAVVAMYGRIDVLVNNAGVPGPLAPLHETSFDDFQRVFQVNATAVFNTMHEVTPVMVQQGYGRIVNVSSASIHILAPHRAAYNASKAAVEVFTKTAAKELGQYGITVNCVAPGGVRTGQLE
eukprot:m51a1_g7874 putative enoyl-[acyl-carrier-protein] reductase (356) ;mRNA; r:22487-24133